MLSVQNVSKLLGKKELFRNVSFHIRPGDRIGLIGSNGSGKSTLFHILLGLIEPDTGQVSGSKSLKTGYLPQDVIPAGDKSVLAHAMDIHSEVDALRGGLTLLHDRLETEKDPAVLTELAEDQAHVLEKLEHLAGYDLESRAGKILEGLGFRTPQFDAPVTSLSGGWIMRLELARLLLSAPDLLLLDEPTNHLDLESLLWLEDYLLSIRSAVVIVAHDRAFLNRIVQRIIELEQAEMHEYTGNYDAFLEEKARRQEIRLSAYKNQQDRIRQIERFVERNRSSKFTAALAQSRVKMLDKIDRIEAPASSNPEIYFTFPQPPRSGKRVIELHGIRKSYGDNTVYAGVDLVVERGDRLAFLGLNGAGKSTLLKILAGVEQADAGERIVGHNTAIGYYAQHQWQQLHPEWTVLQEAGSVSGNMVQSQLRGLLGSFLFEGDDVLKKTVVLSGGEKARLVLCKLLLQNPNFLLLDEPTNHLDIPSRVVLEKALGDFGGTVCFISHDRRFINAIATKVLAVSSGRIHQFPGNYDDYQQIWKSRLEEEHTDGVGREEPDKAKGGNGSNSRKIMVQKRLQAEWRNELFRMKRPIQEQIDSIEAQLDAGHTELERLKERLALPDTYKEGSLVQELRKDYRQAELRIKQLTEAWEESALKLEELEESFSKGKPQQDANE